MYSMNSFPASVIKQKCFAQLWWNRHPSTWKRHGSKSWKLDVKNSEMTFLGNMGVLSTFGSVISFCWFQPLSLRRTDRNRCEMSCNLFREDQGKNWEEGVALDLTLFGMRHSLVKPNFLLDSFRTRFAKFLAISSYYLGTEFESNYSTLPFWIS